MPKIATQKLEENLTNFTLHVYSSCEEQLRSFIFVYSLQIICQTKEKTVNHERVGRVCEYYTPMGVLP